MIKVKIRERKRASGDTYLFLDIYNKGERKQESTGLYYSPKSNNKRDIKLRAEILRKEREKELDSGYLGDSKREIDFISYFKDHNESRGYENADNPYYCALKRLEKFVEGKNIKTTFDRLEFNSKFFEEFVSYLLANVSRNSAWTYFNKVKAVLNKAIRERIILNSPVKNLKISWQEVEKVYVTLEEIKQLINVPCKYPHIKFAFLFSCYTGLRLSDIRKLKWNDIKKDSKDSFVLHFRQKKTTGFEYFPLSQTALNLIYATIEDKKIIPHPETFIFNLPYISKIERTLSSWMKKAEINKHITFNSGRHSFAVNSLSLDVDIFTVSKLLGHRDLKTTMVYAKVVDQKKQQAVDRLPSLEI